jgi:hypothetical protein
MFAPMILGALVGGTASAVSVLSHYRHQLGAMTLREARQLARLPTTPIALATGGLVKLIGVAGSSVSVPSYYHRVPCVCLELHHYEVQSSAGGPRRVLVRTERERHPFWIEDDSGRIAIDPQHTRIDFEVEGGELENAMEEHRIRAGERVAVLGVVRKTSPRLARPMRDASTDLVNGLEFVGQPLLTWRSEPEVYPRLRPPPGGVALSAGSVGLAVLGSILNL